MPNIAQQDYNRIFVDDFSKPTADEKTAIRKAYESGILRDTILYNDSLEARIVSYGESNAYVISDDPGIIEITFKED